VVTPISLQAGDFNNDGQNDPIMSYYFQGKSYPFHSRDELLSQLKPLEKRFPNYTSYANATVLDVIGPRLLENSSQTKVYVLQSCWLENKDGDFELHQLPEQLQFAPTNAFVSVDLDGDGINEIIAGGNFHDFKPQIGMADASKGNILRYENNGLQLAHDVISPLWLEGNVRDMQLLNFANGQKMIAVSRNNDSASIFLLIDNSQ